MKSNKGVTLTSLVVYVVGLVIIISIMSVVSGQLYKNLTKASIKHKANEQYTKFLNYIINDVNSKELEFIQTDLDNKGLIIKFKDGVEHQYIYKNGAIYFLQIKIGQEKKINLLDDVTCNGASMPFIYESDTKTININFNISDETFSTKLNVEL